MKLGHSVPVNDAREEWPWVMVASGFRLGSGGAAGWSVAVQGAFTVRAARGEGAAGVQG